MDHAIHLLSAFMYFSNHLVKELFRGAFQTLSRLYVEPNAPYIQNEAAWQQFRRNLLITHVTGESENETDSGFIFSRLARQELGLSESTIVSPANALSTIAKSGPRPVIFVDDFVGSGDQFLTNWTKEFSLGNGEQLSFQRVSRLRGTRFFYCPILCTALGRRAIEASCKTVTLIPANYLSERYSALAPDSLVWPERLRPTAIEFLRAASARAGLPDGTWKGYNDLALAIAFEHSVPDATLPIFYADQNGWHPLVKRA